MIFCALLCVAGHAIAADWCAKPDPFYSSQPPVPKDEAYKAVLSAKVTKAFPPALPLRGDKDSDVPFGQSKRMDREPARAGVKHQCVRIGGEGRGFHRRAGDPRVQAAFAKELAFQRGHLQ